jgi:hypothetical protein
MEFLCCMCWFIRMISRQYGFVMHIDDVSVCVVIVVKAFLLFHFFLHYAPTMSYLIFDVFSYHNV